MDWTGPAQTTTPASQLQALRAAAAAAEAGLAPEQQGVTPSLFEMLADEVAARGAPSAAWDRFDRLLAIGALTALPERRFFADDIRQLLEASRGDSFVADVAGDAMASYADPGDGWFVDLVRTSLATGAPPLVEPARGVVALGMIGGDAAAELLAGVARRRSHKLAPLAALALARTGDARAEALVLEQLRARPRPEAIEAAGVLRSEAALALLAPWLDPAGLEARARRAPDAVATLLRDAGWALARIGGPGAHRLLAPLLSAADPDIRCAATAAAALLGDPDALAALRRSVDAEDWASVRFGREPFEGRWLAALALAEAGEPAGTEILRRFYAFQPLHAGTAWPSQPADRFRWLQTIGRSGDAQLIGLLDWIAASDRSASDKGWSMAAEAERAILRIRAREARLQTAGTGAAPA